MVRHSLLVLVLLSAAAAGCKSNDGSCHGDDTAWKSLVAGPIACTRNSDCCVIINGCLSQAQVVAASNKVAAKSAWPYCEADCNSCIAPPIYVSCTHGVCTGLRGDLFDAGVASFQEHCGVDTDAPVPVNAQSIFSCGGN